MTAQCPLCESKHIKIIETIDRKDLLQIYRYLMRIDLNYLVFQDLDYCECQKCKLRFFHPMITGDEKFYNVLQKFDWYYMDEKEEYLYAKNYIKPMDKVLEIGSGKGAFTKHIETKDYIGLHFSEYAKILAAQNGREILNLSIEDYARKNPNSIDVVVSFQVIEHVTNPKSFIESSISALKRGG